MPAIATAAAFAAIQGDGRDGFWSRHPMLGALVSGLILLAVAAFGIEAIVRAREARRWGVVAQVAYRAIGIVLRNVLTELAALHVDADVVRRANDGPWKHKGLTPARELKAIPAWRASIAVFADPALPPPTWRVDDSPHPRLRFLIADAAWCRVACDRVELVRDHARVQLREWATLMIHASEPRDRIEEFARITDQLTSLHAALQQAEYEHRARGSVSKARADDVLGRWDLVDDAARRLSNDLWAAAGSEYRFRLNDPVAL